MRFGRRKGGGAGGTSEGAVAGGPAVTRLRLGGLSEEDTATLLYAFTTLLRERGVETTVLDDGMVLASNGYQMGLDNLAFMMASRPRKEWDEMVARHVHTMVGAINSTGFDSIPQEEFLRRVYPRIYRKEVGIPIHPRYRIDLGCDLFVVAALDYPDRVDVLGSDNDLDKRGGWDVVMPQAMANLRALDAPRDLTDSSMREPTTPRLHRWRADDYFGATRFLIVDEMLVAAGDPVGDLGLLFSLPSRVDLFVAVPTPDAVASGSLGHAAEQLSAATVRAYKAQPGSLSPFVYYRAPDGTISQITSADEEGTVSLELPAGLRA